MNLEVTFETEALKRRLLSIFEEYAKFNRRISQDLLISILLLEDNVELTDVIASNLIIKTCDKQKVLEENDLNNRLKM